MPNVGAGEGRIAATAPSATAPAAKPPIADPTTVFNMIVSSRPSAPSAPSAAFADRIVIKGCASVLEGKTH
jgi:hypothetical protein